MRLYWIKWDSNAITGVLSRTGKYGRTYTGSMPFEGGSEDCRDAATSQGTPKTACSHQTLERGKEGSSPRAFKGSVALQTLWFQTCRLLTWANVLPREHISVVLSHRVGGTLFQPSWWATLPQESSKHNQRDVSVWKLGTSDIGQDLFCPSPWMSGTLYCSVSRILLIVAMT